MKLTRLLPLVMVLAAGPVAGCADRDDAAVPADTRRPLTTEEFFSLDFGRGWLGPDGGAVSIDLDSMTVTLDDKCNQSGGRLEFADGVLRFPAEGLSSTELACEGVEGYFAAWIFGQWMVEPDGSLVVISSIDGEEYPVPGSFTIR